MLDLSHLAVRARLAGRPQEITVQWTPDDAAAWDAALQAGGTVHVGTLVRRALPERLAAMVLAAAQVEGATPVAQLRREERRRLVDGAHRDAAALDGRRGLQEGGGHGRRRRAVARSIRARWRAARKPGLFLCGEMLDAFGPIGGYNFLWAWVTGRAAGVGAVGVR